MNDPEKEYGHRPEDSPHFAPVTGSNICDTGKLLQILPRKNAGLWFIFSDGNDEGDLQRKCGSLADLRLGGEAPPVQPGV